MEGRRGGWAVAAHENANPIAGIAGFPGAALRGAILLVGDLGLRPLGVSARHRPDAHPRDEKACRRQSHLIPSRRKRLTGSRRPTDANGPEQEAVPRRLLQEYAAPGRDGATTALSNC